MLDKDTEISWIKFGEVDSASFIGKDTVILGYGNYIVFVDTAHPEKKDLVFRATTKAKGDGVQCLCTHRTLSCFAFAEKCCNPRILINAFPSFENLKTIDAVQETGYIALRFSEMEYLVALTGVPNYMLIVWNWRTSDKLYSRETNICRPSQSLRVSLTSPVQIAQADTTEKTLIVWDLHCSYKKAALTKNWILLPEESQAPYAYAWGFDGDLYFVDSTGNLYSVSSESRSCNLALEWKGDQGRCNPCLTWYKGGWIFSGPGKVYFYRRKSPEGWSRIWSFTPAVPLKVLVSSTFKDVVVGLSENHELIQIKGETTVDCITIRGYGCGFDFLCLVNPVGKHFVTYGSIGKAITVWSKIEGLQVGTFPLIASGNVNDVKSNPKYPYLAMVCSTGKAYLINLYDPTSPFMLNEIYLTREPLNMIRFDSTGERFCVGNTNSGEFFVVKLMNDPKPEVIATVKLDLKIVDFALIGKGSSPLLVILTMSQLCCKSGQTILLYSVNSQKKTCQQVDEVTMPTVVTSIVPKSQSELICVPHRSRSMYIAEITSGNVISKIVTGHQMRSFSVAFNGFYLISYGSDGLAIIRSAKGVYITVVMPHHRMAKGIKEAIIDPYCQYILTLGVDGTIICFQYKGEWVNAKLQLQNEALLKSTEYKQIFFVPLAAAKAKAKALEKSTSHRGTPQFEESLETKTWLEIREKERIEQNEKNSQKEKADIILELEELKKQLQELLDANLESLPIVRLPVHAFDLDKATRRKKIEDAKAEREKERHMQLATIKARDKVSDAIKKLCWDSVDIKGRELRGIVSSTVVESYPLLNVSKESQSALFWTSQRLKMEEYYRKGDYFEPWVPRSSSMLQLHLNATTHISEEDVAQTVKTMFEDELDERTNIAEKTDKDSPLLWSGTSTHNFISVSPYHYNQFELLSYSQGISEIQLIQAEIRSLMVWFNDQFDEIYASKEREVASICEKNNRFRHIINELNFFRFSPEICKTVVKDPEWSPFEQPERILRVEDHELSVTPYVTQSQEEIMKKKKEEEERIRLMLLADDFKERALITMMDGVLEKLWENEIKKEVPKPKCMTDKDPENYTEDDLKAIRMYEEALRNLLNERERYRKILEADWAKIINSVRDIINRFDDKLAKLHMLKMKVESAIGQEMLKILRIRLKCQEKLEIQKKEKNLRDEMANNEKKIESTQLELSKFVETLGECRNYYEALQSRDRNLDKNFKKEFPDLSPFLCEQLYKLSKKRPKMLQKAALFSTVLNDVGKYAIAGTKPDYLTLECVQYLKDIDALDNNANAPSSVTEQAWELMCKMRRTKIDCELKIRACAVDLGEAESTVANYQKRLKNAKEYQTQLQNELYNLRQEKLLREENGQIQLVLKCGLVETPLTGRISDFEDSVLVTKSTLLEINGIIAKAGNQKLKAMKKAANFRKGIIFKEWEHKKLRMEIEDLKNSLSTVENIKVTKELQSILVARARGFADEKGFLYLEEEILAAKERMRKSETKLMSQIDHYTQQIEQLNAKNKDLDSRIAELNADVNELNMMIDKDFEAKRMTKNLKRMKKVRYRSKLVQKIQEQHNEILMLQTELELLRLRTFPTLKSKT